MPVPQLNTNYLSLDPAGAYAKAAQVKNYLLQGQIAEQQLADAPLERRFKEAKIQNYLTQGEREKENLELDKMMKRFEITNKIMQAPSKEIAKKLGQQFGIEVDWVGPEVTFTDQESGYILKGPASQISDMTAALSRDPSMLTDEPVTVNTPNGTLTGTKLQQTMAMMRGTGISLTKRNPRLTIQQARKSSCPLKNRRRKLQKGTGNPINLKGEPTLKEDIRHGFKSLKIAASR